MEEANERAAQAILGLQKSDQTGVLDLHGLYVKEAEAATSSFLLAQQRAKRFQEVEIVTGAGHHSSHQQAKIKVSCYLSSALGKGNMYYRVGRWLRTKARTVDGTCAHASFAIKC